MQSNNHELKSGHEGARRACWLIFCLLFLAAALPAGAADVDRPTVTDHAVEWTRADAAHLLRRAGFGGTPQQIDKLFAMGWDGAVEYLLTGQAPAGIEPVFAPVTFEMFKPTPPPEPDPELEKKAELARAAKRAAKTQPALGNPSQRQPSSNPAALQTSQDAVKKLQQQKKKAGRQDLERLRTWWIDRMIRTDRPLEEKLTLFWHGLFTSGAKEVRNPLYLVEQNALFHSEATGNYKQLTHDIIHGAAMLRYLNNDQNVRGKPNENLAREMLELFTMGEGNGYTETDIKEIARALTGLAPSGGKKNGDGTVALRPRVHDDGTKTIFGKTGNFGPDDVVDLVFDRPEPARYLARKLWEFFAYPEPSDSDLAPVVAVLVQSKFELKPALRAIFTSPSFYSERAQFSLIKSPTELAVEEMRTLGITPTEADEIGIDRRLKAMDQELLQPPNVRGWVGGDNWITSATLYARYNTASAGINGSLRFADVIRPNAKKTMPPGRPRQEPRAGLGAVDPAKLFASLGQNPSPETVVDAAVERFLQRPLIPAKREALLDVIGAEPLQLGDSRSDARVREMICLLLSTPEYQVH